MSGVHDESGENSPRPAATPSSRILEDTLRVTRGFLSGLGTIEDLVVHPKSLYTPKGTVEWIRIDVGCISFNHSASLLFLQGIPLSGYLRAPKDFILLGVVITPFYHPPIQAQKVVFARILSAPKTLKQEELLGGLVQEVIQKRVDVSPPK